MSVSRPPFPSEPHNEFLTIRISKTAALLGLVALIVIAAFIGLGLPGKKDGQVALASNPTETQELHAATQPPAASTLERDDASLPPTLSVDTKINDPEPPHESQSQNEAAANPTASNQPEANTVAVTTTRIIQRERVILASPPTQPDAHADEAPSPINQPDQPMTSSPTTPDPPRPSSPPTIPSVLLNGAGATFPFPLYSKWFTVFDELNPGTQINYQSIGSGAGLHELLEGTIDFGASDIPASDEQLRKAGIPIVQIPTALGAVVPICNFAGGNRELKFTPDVLAGIFLGRIVSWNDPAIANANPNVNLPEQPIVVVHRSDGNAATFTFADYLSKVNPAWEKTVGKGTSVDWLVGLGAKGNEGIADIVHRTPGAIGYIDLLYAEQNHLPFGSVSNAAGKFVKANLRSVTEAAASAAELPQTFGLSITNAPGKDAYPIASFTWLLVPQRAKDPAKGQNLVAFLYWMLDNGQPIAETLGYAPLPRKVADQVKKTVAKLH